MRSDEQVHPTPGVEEIPETVLLDRSGVVVAANQALLDVSRAAEATTDRDGDRIGIGISLLALCEAASADRATTDRPATDLAAAVRDAVRGDLPVPVRLRSAWPPTPAGRRFDVIVSSRRDGWGDCVGATITVSPGADGARPPATPTARPGPAARRSPRPFANAEPYRSAFELAPIGMAVIRLDEQGGRTIVRANAALSDLFGVPRDRLTGADLAQYSTPGNLDHDRRIVADLLSGARTSYARLKSYRRTDGRLVWAEVRVTRVDIPGEEGATALAHFVDVTDRHEATRRRARQSELDAAGAEIATSVLAGRSPGEVHRLVADVTAQMFDADDVTLLLPGAPNDESPEDGSSDVGAAGVGAAGVGEPGGLTAVAELGSAEGGQLVVARPAGGEPFDADDLALLAALAQQVGLAVELGRARADQQRLAVLEDRERIARDLHDTVVQDLLAVGMELAAGLRPAEGGPPPEPRRVRRDAALVGRLEEAVRRLRGSVFELRHPELTRPLPDAVRAVATEASRVLGHRPLVRINGGVEQVPPAVGDAVVAVLREGLSNVARHAHAHTTDVDLTVEARRLQLVVSDDGRGLPPVLVAGDGIANVRQRAVDLRGHATVEPRPDGGTRLVWSCPLPGDRVPG